MKNYVSGKWLLLIGIASFYGGVNLVPGAAGALISVFGLICVGLSIPAFIREKRNKK